MVDTSALRDWGWDDAWAATFALATGRGAPAGASRPAPPLQPARVVSQERDRWLLATGDGPRPARLDSGRRLDAYPVTGDWVAVRPGPMPSDPWSLRAVLPRRSRFTRGGPGAEGEGEEQVLAANVDRVWIVHGLDLPPNERRLERFLALAWESGATPEIVLTKADIAADADGAVAAVEGIAFGVPVHRVSVMDDSGIAALIATLEPATTVALLGPSGVGKSSLVNRLSAGEVTATGDVRADRKGRHTTTGRQLFPAAGGALLLDTPGLRELQLTAVDEGLQQAFPEIDRLAAGCRFRDCRHEAEPGCSVLEAVEAGAIPADRLASYRKLGAEAEYQRRRTDARARAEAVSEYKSIMKSLKHHPKYRDR